MLIVLLLVSIGIIVLGWVAYDSWDMDLGSMFITAFGIFGVIAVVITYIALSIDLTTINVIPDKIAILQEQNTKIEAQIDVIAEQYMDYESETYKGMTPDNAELFAVLYPQLASNETVKKQMELYINNNKAITDYKLEMCNASVYRWWLYFGK